MKSTKKLNPLDPAPFDFFDLMNEAELEKWKKQQVVSMRECVKNSTLQSLLSIKLLEE